MGRRVVLDIEATGLDDENSIDYTTIPYSLRPEFEIHCIVCTDVETEEAIEFRDWDEWLVYMEDVEEIIGHNVIAFDLLILKLYFGIPYTVTPDSWNNRKVKITDTLILSKLLNPDREGHSLEWWGKKLGCEKIDYRKIAIELGIIPSNAPKGLEFSVYTPQMGSYCKQDTITNLKVYKALCQEAAGWDWKEAYALEKAVAEIITRQKHRGFKFDVELAKECIIDLDKMMEEIRNKIEPIIPPKKPTQAILKQYTPPKIQVTKNGAVSAVMLKWLEKHEGELVEETTEMPRHVCIGDKKYRIPMPLVPIISSIPATINDTTHIKEWLVSIGWEPTAFKERDLSVDTQKKKLSTEKYIAVVERYVEQTLETPFCKRRCEFLECSPKTLKAHLMSKGGDGKPVRVLTNPTFTIGQEKEICPNLEAMSEQFPFARDIINYLTYRHRRNSILGGGQDWDEWEDDEDSGKGFLAHVRQDGRIPTPIDTLGAATSRVKHRLVANIPRVTSLYGDKMRSLFGSDEGSFTLGWDFDSLEARIEGHYCYQFPGGPEYSESLTALKPNDVHSVLSRKITETVGFPVSRPSAKNCKYGATFGAQPNKLSKMIGCSLEDGEKIFNAFWLAASPLKCRKTLLEKQWQEVGGKKFIVGLDGRKVPTRAKHALLNSLIQSAGVICAKRATFIYDRKLKAAGLIVDFFEEDWTQKSYCQEMQYYHDELCMEVDKKSVKFKTFDSEEEARAYSIPDKIVGEVQHTGDKWWRAYCLAGQLAVEAVRETGEYYKLNVPLSTGYNIGRNWSEVH